ncbi:uncharacterized protein LOC128430247 [Pleuronectes platessa]|uniref:uncharacterized protein LOC128430247 n=1 Tax=Pleuronectes platessa TaxID=8262 RepID=UPI00232A2B8C|nr:uncharacterized protein LOC128430247 [Pleuronectes platessa]
MSAVTVETAVITEVKAVVAMATNMEDHVCEQPPPLEEELKKPASRRRRAGVSLGRRGQKGKKWGPADKRRGPGEKRRGQKEKRRGQEEKKEKKKEGVTVKRMWSGGKRQYCVFCRRPQVKIARHLLRKHTEEPEVMAASTLPTGSKQRHLLLDHLRCRGNYLHNIEVIRQGSGEIIPCRQPSEEVDARNYLPCPLCLGFFLRSDLWKHQASCRKKLSSNPSKDSASTTDTTSDTTSDYTGKSVCDRGDNRTSRSTEDTLSDPQGDTAAAEQTCGPGSKQPDAAAPSGDQNATSDPGVDRPRKRIRVQAAASRLLPISGGASESCSEVLHRMNQDHISHQVKSDWLICKYGNKLMGNQDGGQKRYDYVSQKLRELGRFLLAAKSLDSGVHALLDVLAPGRLSLALAAARKASGYRWSRPPLAVKTTLKTVCEIAIGESLQDGDWEAAAKTTDFYHILGREWDNLGLLNPDAVAPEGGTKQKKQLVQPRNEKSSQESEPSPVVPSKSSSRPDSSVPPESRLQTPLTVPVAPRKVRRRPWSSAEKEAVWRQLGVHVLVQTVPGKEVCQRCLDLEPVLRGRHWKDIKNQVHNQIQSQKKQQFHAQMDLQDPQEQPNQEHDQTQTQKKQHQHFQAQMDQQGKDHTQNQKKQEYRAQIDHQDQDNVQNQKKQQYHLQLDQQNQDHTQKKQQFQVQMDHQDQESIQNHRKQHYHTQMDHQDHLQLHKKQLCHSRLDQPDHIQVHKKQLYQMDQQTQVLQSTLDRDASSLLTGTPFGPDGLHRATGLSLVERDPIISPYPLPHRAPGLHMDQLLPRTEWTDESLAQNYPINRQLARSLLPDAPTGGPLPSPHSGHVHF